MSATLTASRNGKAPARIATVRCAIYTRKSSEEGLEQEFNLLDAQREAAEAYIGSQQHEGWQCLPDRFDDGGYTGGNMDRPALRRLMADIQAGRVDTVVCYKVDRLSRSLLDFARMMETFEKHRVSFVSVTQQFNTATSMGRLVLNVLLSFAQFEREMVSERTRDKIAATRRRGKWTGGLPLLGYDVDPVTKKLVVNEPEAERVRAIFRMYLEHQSLLPVVRDLARRGWINKRWQTCKGHEKGGQPFTRTSLYRLLTNVVYSGRVRYKAEVHPGEHRVIVEDAMFEQVQTILRRNGTTGGATVRNQFGMLLQGLLHCRPCGCAMTPSHTTKKKSKTYRYYVCTGVQKKGWDTCPSKSIPAGTIEDFVVEQIRDIGRDPALRNEVLAQVRRKDEEQRTELRAEQRELEKDLHRWHDDVRSTSGQLRPGESGPALARLADLQERIRASDERLTEVRNQLHELEGQAIDEKAAAEALAAFEPVWQTLTPKEQANALHQLVQRVDYDGERSNVSITFHPTAFNRWPTGWRIPTRRTAGEHPTYD